MLEMARRAGSLRASAMLRTMDLPEQIVALAHAGEVEEAKKQLGALESGTVRVDPESLRQLRALIDEVPAGMMRQPEGAAGWNTLGSVWMDLGKPEEAQQCFSQALDADADYEPAWLNWCLLYGRFREFDQALFVVERYLGSHDRSAAGWRMKGMVLANLERQEEAVQAYRRSLDLEPKHAETWHLLSTALLRSDRPAEALEACDRALTLSDGYLDALANRGRALTRLGREREAIECGRIIQQRSPERAAELFGEAGS